MRLRAHFVFAAGPTNPSRFAINYGDSLCRARDVLYRQKNASNAVALRTILPVWASADVLRVSVIEIDASELARLNSNECTKTDR